MFLKEESRDKLKDPKKVEEIIKEEIPYDEYPVLKDTVARHNIHNPCVEINPNAVCMVKIHKPSGRNLKKAVLTVNGNERT